MKKVRLICLLMALVIVCPLFASCGGNKLVANIDIKFVVPAEEEGGEDIVLLEKKGYQVVGKQEDLTVLKAAEQILMEYEKTYSLTEDGNSIGQIQEYKNEETYDDTYGYFKVWKCTVDGQDSSEGRQSVTPIYDQSVVVFTYTSGQELRKDTSADEEETDPADYETMAIEEETEAETEEE